MKTLRLMLVLVVGFALANTPVFGYVVAPNTTENATTLSNAEEEIALSAKELKKQQKKEARAQKRAERRAKFIAWLGKVMAGDEQIVAILLAFFVGWLGIHRLYLGSDPIIILWYIITLGGFFGLIPLIDFIRLVIGQVDHYRDNSSLFRAFQPA
ncbi:MAG: TM2 domain-containing protein [Saprospiraceae bacterium]|nr:TM2 domain-containing protein [Saprospiraceae bacterium]